jgi:hypothetical protein
MAFMSHYQEVAGGTISLFAIVLPFLFALWASSYTRRFSIRAIAAALTVIALLLGLLTFIAGR